jgi:hypothetical protein
MPDDRSNGVKAYSGRQLLSLSHQVKCCGRVLTITGHHRIASNEIYYSYCLTGQAGRAGRILASPGSMGGQQSLAVLSE